MQRLTDDPRTANCQVYLFLWARPPFHLFDSVLHLFTLHPSSTQSDPLQHTFFHLNLIVTSYLSPDPYGLLSFFFFFFFNIAPNTCMQKGEVWLVSLHIDADHTGVLFQVGSWPHNGSPRWPREGCSFYKGLSLFLTPIESPFPSSQRRVIRTALHLTYRVAIISTHQGLPPSSLDFKAKRLISCGPWKKGTQFQIQLHIPFEWN